MIWPKRRQEVTGKTSKTIRLNHMKFLIFDFFFFFGHKRGNFISFNLMVFVLWMKIIIKILLNTDYVSCHFSNLLSQEA